MSQPVETALPSEANFAFEVRTERLQLLVRLTLVGSIVLFWLATMTGTLSRTMPIIWVWVSIMIAAGSILAAWLLKTDHYHAAVWAYTGGMILGVATLMYGPPDTLRMLVPYSFVLLIFIVGLLMPASALIPLSLLAALVILGVPSIYDGELVINDHQIAALVFTGVGALFAAQISGELYAIAEWALKSYQRERERKLELHESRDTVTRALARAEVLAENLEVANRELEVARAAAEEAKNFRGQFLANMSHELRTPLNAVIGFSETMLTFPEMYDNIPLPQEYERDLQQIFTSGNQLLHVINDILDLSKVDAGKLDVQYGTVHLDSIFRATFSTATGLIGDKPIQLKRDLPPELPDVWADANRVRQVLLNLYSNAVKFTDEGSITLALRVEADRVVISVADTGCGVEEDERDLIFEEFRQGKAGTSKQHTGSGLGLSISRHLVRLMHGQIWMESEVGVGSTFYFSLPLAAPKDVEANHREVSALSVAP